MFLLKPTGDNEHASPLIGEMKLKRTVCPAIRSTRGAYTLLEVFIATFLLGTVLVSLYATFSSGLAVVSLAREDLRATQIMLKRMENIRLYNWTQMLSTNYIPTNAVTTYYDPSGQGSSGTVYTVIFDPPQIPAGLPNGYKNNMRLVTIRTYWTNYLIGTNKIVRSRTNQTYVARFGMQNYIDRP